MNDDGPLCIRDHEKPARSTSGFLCDHHDDLLQGWLADIEDWYLYHRVFAASALSLSITDPRAGNEWGNPSYLDQTTKQALPAHLNPLTGLAESNGRDVPDIPALVDTWAQVLAEEAADVTVVPESFAARLSLLRRHVLWIEAQPWLDEFMDDMRAAQTALAKVVGEASGPRPLGPCLNCGTNMYSTHELELWASRREHRDPDFHRLDGDDAPDRIECKGCGECLEGTAIIRWRLAQEAG